MFCFFRWEWIHVRWYLIRHPNIKAHPSPIGHGCAFINGSCCPVRNTKPVLLDYLTPHTETNDTEQHLSDEGEYSDSDIGADIDCESEMEYDHIDTDSESDDHSDLNSDWSMIERTYKNQLLQMKSILIFFQMFFSVFL